MSDFRRQKVNPKCHGLARWMVMFAAQRECLRCSNATALRRGSLRSALRRARFRKTMGVSGDIEFQALLAESVTIHGARPWHSMREAQSFLKSFFVVTSVT